MSHAGSAPPFSVITGRAVHDLIFQDIQGCIDVVREAYLAHSQGRTENPVSQFLRFKDRSNARIISLPAHLDSPWSVSGVKWIASYPDNVARRIPRASAVLLLNDHDTGYPFACIEASIISASRTAASAVLAALHLNGGNRRSARLGIIGTGLIARYVYRFLLATEWEFDQVRAYDLATGEAQRFLQEVCEPARHRQLAAAEDAAEVIRDSDLLLFTTTAASPYVHDPALFSHRPVVLHLSLRDLSPEMILRAFNVVDDVEHVMHANTSAHLAEQLVKNRDFIHATLSDVILQTVAVDHSRPVIFSPFGLGLLDVALGKWVFDRAMAAEAHVPIEGFFYDLAR